jgi:heme-degrading monooxygenase HmoA
MPQLPRSFRPFAALMTLAGALTLVAGCGGSATRESTTSTPPADTASQTAQRPELSPNTIFAFTWFDKDQGANVASQWARARDAMGALGGHKFAYVFTTMDWERTSNLLAVSAWDDEVSAIRGLKVSEAQVPARGWAKSALFRPIATDGDMGDSLFKSVVMVMPVSTAMDSAQAVTDFDTINTFMRGQPGYIASVLFERVSGDGTYQHVIAARWATREDLQKVRAVPQFETLRQQVKVAGVPTTYLQLMI